MQAVIDRFEGELAVLEIEGKFKNVPRRNIPEGAREGDVLVFKDQFWIIDKELTLDRKKANEALLRELLQE